MTTAADLLDRCEGLGIRLWSEAGRLLYEAPPGRLAPDLRALLTAHKPELVHRLDRPDPEAVRASYEAIGLREIEPGVFAAPGYESWTF